MGKRRSVIRQVINRLLMSGRPGDYTIVYIDRGPTSPSGLGGVSASRVVAVSEWAMTLDDGTVIPLHRVVEVRDRSGAVVWRRAGREGRG